MGLFRARTELGAASVLLADSDLDAQRWLGTVLAGQFDLDELESGAATLERLGQGGTRIVVVGRRLADMTGDQLLAHLPEPLPVIFLLADEAGEHPHAGERELNVFYRLVRSMPAERVRSLVAQAAATLPPAPPPDLDPALAASVAAHTAPLVAATEPEAAAHAAIDAVRALVGADRAHCLYCDDQSGALWSGIAPPTDDAVEFDPLEGHASGGIAGFAVRAVAAVALTHAASDPNYRADIDDPGGNGRERLAVQPVTGVDGHVHAVLVAVRDERKQPFTGADLDKLAALASAWAPSLVQLSMRVEAEGIIGDKLDQAGDELFRQEAIEHLVKRGARGDVVRVHPGWVRAAYWLVLAAIAAGFGFASVAHVHQYAEGPAVVRFTGRSDVVTFEGGTIESLTAVRGARVKKGEELARLYDTEEIAKLRALEGEHERKLVAYLLTPADPAVRQALAAVVSERESARSAAESRKIRAPQDGVIKEVLVRNGQHVDPGKVVATVVEDAAHEGLSVLAFLPGSERPRLHAHQHLRFTLPGYRGAKIGGEVRAVSAEILGAAEARTRYLGEQLGESLPISGTVVVVEALLSSPEFESDGQTFQLHDGMMGQAEIQLQSRTVLETMVPGLHR